MRGIVRWFVELNFPTLIVLVFMSVFLTLNSIFKKRINRLFGFSLFIAIVEMFVYSAELWESEHGNSAAVCIFFCAVGYSVRPILIYIFVKLSLRNEKTGRLFTFLILLPMVLNALAAFSAFFTNIVYTYNSSNEFVIGPLGFFTHVVCIFYMILLLKRQLNQHIVRNPNPFLLFADYLLQKNIFCYLSKLPDELEY